MTTKLLVSVIVNLNWRNVLRVQMTFLGFRKVDNMPKNETCVIHSTLRIGFDFAFHYSVFFNVKHYFLMFLGHFENTTSLLYFVHSLQQDIIFYSH